VPNPATQPIAVLGGTFDPVHNAHLAIARSALERLGVARILWIPTGMPGYRKPAVAPASDRVAMLKLALKDERRYAIDEREIQPGASAYTHDTLEALRAENPGAEFTLLMGADQYAQRAAWHRWPELEKLCRIAVIERPDTPKPKGNVIHLPMTPLAISASDIRARVSRGEDISAMVPAPVLQYIKARKLYN
jgi:nicotinate-nucleotide adenylyltransferase